MNRNQAIQIYNTLFFPSAARVFAQYEGVPQHLGDGPEPDRGPGKRRAAALLRAMADALDPLTDDASAAVAVPRREAAETLTESGGGRAAEVSLTLIEWGIYRVKWQDGRAVEVWQTSANFSDLDAAIKRGKEIDRDN